MEAVKVAGDVLRLVSKLPQDGDLRGYVHRKDLQCKVVLVRAAAGGRPVRECKGMEGDVKGGVDLVLNLCDLIGRHVLDDDPFADHAQAAVVHEHRDARRAAAEIAEGRAVLIPRNDRLQMHGECMLDRALHDTLDDAFTW